MSIEMNAGRSSIFSRSSVIAALLAIVVGVMALAHRWMADDGFIYLRIVENVLDGHGPVFNPGVRVEVGTSPLWLALLSIIGWVFPFPLEWIAIAAGIFLSMIGVFTAVLASQRLSGTEIPFGLIAFCSTPFTWHFATSGLENGLSFAFIGFSALALSWLTNDRPTRTDFTLGGLLIGLGPVVRPDLAIVSGALITAVMVRHFRERPRPWTFVASALILPVAVEILRMGFFRSVFPNTVLAKGGGVADWTSGFTYLADALLVPTVLYVVFALVMTFRRSSDFLTPSGTLLLAAAAHGLLVVRAGGDFMRLRLLLPTILLAAIVAVGSSTAIQTRVLAASLLATGLIMTLGPQYESALTARIHDERAITIGIFGSHPVLANQVSPNHPFSVAAHLARKHPDRLIEIPEGNAPVVYGSGYGVLSQTIGILGFKTGGSVHIWDRYAISDPIGARFELEKSSRRKGHEKYVSDAWFDGQMQSNPLGSEDAAIVEEFLQCDRIASLMMGLTDPMTMNLFFENLSAAVPDTFLRFPSEPEEALDVCDAIS